jgi:hypothetical protein
MVSLACFRGMPWGRVVRANERTAAFVALYTLQFGNPLLATMDAFRMIEPPSVISRNAFCTVNRAPLTLISKTES